MRAKRLKYSSLKTRKLLDKTIRLVFIYRHLTRKKAAMQLKSSSPNFKKIFISEGLLRYSEDLLSIKPLVGDVVKECNNLLKNTEILKRNQSNKNYLQHLMRRDDFLPNSSVVTLAFNKQLVGLVADLLDDFPVLADLALLYSPALGSYANTNESFTGSQLFHMDADDVTLCKVWVLLKDVGTNDGPTVIVKKSKSFEVANAINYRKGGRIKNDQQILDRIQDQDLITILGKAGEVMFIDTAGVFHYGSRVSGGSHGRFMLLISYATSFAVEHGILGRKSPMRNYKIEKVKSDLTHKQKFMLVNSKKI